MNAKLAVFRSWKTLAACSVSGTLGVGMPSATAVDYTWVSPTAAVYTSAAAWLPSGPPGASDNIIWNDAGGAGDMAINLTGTVAVTNVFMSVSSGQRTTRISGNFAPIFTISGTISKTGGSIYSITGRNDGSGSNEMIVNAGHVDLQEGTLNFGSLGIGTTSSSAALRAVTIGSASLADGTTMGFAVGRNATTGTATITGNLHMAGASTVNVRNRAGTAAGQSTILAVGSLTSTGGDAVIQANDFASGNPTTALLRLNNASGVSVFGGIIQNGGAIANVMSVEKNNDGTQVLTGANTYTGATTINAGTLVIDGAGSINNTAGVVINGGRFVYSSSVDYTQALTFNSGTLGGTNLNGVSLTGANAIGAGKVLSPGHSPGTLEVDDVEFQNGGAYLWEINSLTGTQGGDPGWDWINGAGGNLDLSLLTVGGFTLTIDSLNVLDGWDTNGTYAWTIASFDNIVGFNATNFALNTSAFGDQNDISGGSFSLQLVNNELVLNYSAIPEPGVVMLLLGGCGMAVLLRRARRVS
jgi:autotransporter-associated beta strand protein